MKIDCYGKLKRCPGKKGGLNKRVARAGLRVERRRRPQEVSGEEERTAE